MNLITATLFPKPAALPPVIDGERQGNIRRNFCAKLAKPKPPITYGPRLKKQLEQAKNNRARIYEAIIDGHNNIPKLVEKTTLATGTLWGHIHALIKDGKIDTNKSVKPWQFKSAVNCGQQPNTLEAI